MLTVGSLFSGIGGFDLGLERTGGFRTVWFCEQDDYCRRVLNRHWPAVPVHPDITELCEPEPVDVLCGGFPCQDISVAGQGAGIEGERSGLWSEYARIIGELRPRYVIVENVPALLARGVGVVLGDLAALGYDAEWDCIPASAVGAPHRRDRIWIVAYPGGERREWWPGEQGTRRPPAERSEAGDHAGDSSGASTLPAHTAGDGRRQGRQGRSAGDGPDRQDIAPQRVADTDDAGREQRRWPVAVPEEQRAIERGCEADRGWPVDDALLGRHGAPDWPVRAGRDGPVGSGWWATEPAVGRVAHGVPARVDRLRALGNALVPQIAEWIGHRILDHEGGVTHAASAA